jgi:fatty-acid desaturase
MRGNLWKNWAFRFMWLVILITGPMTLAYGVYHQEWYWLMGSLLMTPFIGGGLGIDIAMHRYLSHRSFSTTKNKHYFLSILAFLSGQGSPIHYACVHRHHHKHSDTGRDIHSPHNRPVLHAGWLWMIEDMLPKLDSRVKMGMRDLMNDPMIKCIDKWYFQIWALIFILGLIINWKALAFLILLPAWKGYLEIFMTNVLMHIKTPGSYRNFETPDHSQNANWYTWFCQGQGMHNNHHAYPGKYYLKLFPHDNDIAGEVIKRFFIENNPKKIYHF